MADQPSDNYQVLARKYRPKTFNELIGQEPMVRILTNAFSEERIAQAYILTGVRGVGKTTTARIIAKGLNCTANGAKKPVQPCGQCESCINVSEGRHIDVLELDAASRSQVSEMRDILENVSFDPSAGRYKIYLIDEIHMLSTHAFNALLKTLEEPPANVKFIFATTEIRKVPVTVLSRCQRFDLRRIKSDRMKSHLSWIANEEKIEISDEALDLIIRSAEGSVRDAVSLLDQAVGQSSEKIESSSVREMLGLADRSRTLDLLEMILKGDVVAALSEVNSQYSGGADPQAMLRDLAETVHLVSILHVSPKISQDIELTPEEVARGSALAKQINLSTLSRTWQMLMKALEEAPHSPTPIMAVEMAVIRLCYVKDYPSAANLLEKFTGRSTLAPLLPQNNAREEIQTTVDEHTKPVVSIEIDHETDEADRQELSEQLAPEILVVVQSKDDLIKFLHQFSHSRIADEVNSCVDDVAVQENTISLQLSKAVSEHFTATLTSALNIATQKKWQVVTQWRSNDSENGCVDSEAIAEGQNELRQREAEQHPLTRAVMEAFPGSTVSVRHAIRANQL